MAVSVTSLPRLYCPVEGDTEPAPEGLMVTLRVCFLGTSSETGFPQAPSKRILMTRIDKTLCFISTSYAFPPKQKWHRPLPCSSSSSSALRISTHTYTNVVIKLLYILGLEYSPLARVCQYEQRDDIPPYSKYPIPQVDVMADTVNTVDIVCGAEERKAKLLPLLNGNIFHVTSFQSFGANIEEGVTYINHKGIEPLRNWEGNSPTVASSCGTSTGQQGHSSQ